MGTYGRQLIENAIGHPLQVLADGAGIWHPIGITVDWATVVAAAADVTFPDLTTVKAGQKYLRYGQVLVKDGSTWKPYAGAALKRSETVLLNQSVIEEGSLYPLTRPVSDHPGVLDGGLCWKDRILANLATPVAQVETATVLGTIGAAGAGNAKVTVTSAGMTGSPIVVVFAVANNDTDAQVAGKARTALGLNAVIAARFGITGAGAAIILTRLTPFAANDTTLNIAIDNDTSTGLTAAPASANTTAGVADNGGPTFALLEVAMPQLRYA